MFAREIFADAVAHGVLVKREGWFQPASCGDECHSPYSNPASRELLGIENMIEAEAMAEGQLDARADTGKLRIETRTGGNMAIER